MAEVTRAPATGSAAPDRRLVAVGAIRRNGHRTTHITATLAGVTGRITGGAR